MKHFKGSGINVDCVRVLVHVLYSFHCLKVVHDTLVQENILGLKKKRSRQKQNKVSFVQYSGAAAFTT